MLIFSESGRKEGKGNQDGKSTSRHAGTIAEVKLLGSGF